MTTLDTLRLLLTAELPDTVEGCDLSITEICRRLDDIDPVSVLYFEAHARIDQILEYRLLLSRESA